MKLKVIPALIITLFLVLILSYACTKKDVYPIEPHIDLMLPITLLHDSAGIDQQGIIKLYFTDGDGDLGLRPYDTTAQYRYNIFIKYFEKKKGKFEEIILTTLNPLTLKLDTIGFNGRIPDLTPVGKSKAISGEISDTLFVNNRYSTFDTIKYQIYVQDRAFHKSNIVETPEIVINKKALKP